MGIIPFYFFLNCFLLPSTRYFLLWFVRVTSKFSMKDWFANCALQKDFVSLHKNLYLIGDVDNMKSVLTDLTHSVIKVQRCPWVFLFLDINSMPHYTAILLGLHNLRFSFTISICLSTYLLYNKVSLQICKVYRFNKFYKNL
jgi:hypothetical protein